MPLPLLDGKDTDPLVQTWFEIVHLKQLYPGMAGSRSDPTRCETVAEHSFERALSTPGVKASRTQRRKSPTNGAGS